MLMINLHCAYDTETASEDDLVNVQFYWSATFIATVLSVTPVKDVPIIPTALAKTLSNSVDLMLEDTVKIGYVVPLLCAVYAVIVALKQLVCVVILVDKFWVLWLTFILFRVYTFYFVKQEHNSKSKCSSFA